MYLRSFIDLLAGGVASRRNRRRTSPRDIQRAARDLEAFNAHLLRDIGYVRDIGVAPRRHILWM